MDVEHMTDDFESTENENSASSSEETNDIDPTQSSPEDNPETETKTDNDEPFHKRWKEYTSDWKEKFNKQEERHLSEMTKLREEFLQNSSQAQEKPVDIPKWWGGDEKSWGDFQEYQESIKNQAAQEALEKINSKTQEEQRQLEEATQYMKNTVDELESDRDLNPDGKQVDRNKLLKFTMENDLVDSSGRWNYRAAYLLMQAQENMNKSNLSQDKKKLASVTTTQNTTEPSTKDYKTADDFKFSRPW